MSRNLQLQVVLNAIDKATGPIKAIMNSSSGLGKQLKQTRDQLKGLNQQQRDIASYKAQKNAVAETAKKLTEAREKMRGMSAELKNMKVPSEQFQREFYKSSEAVKKLNEKHGEQRKALAGTVRQFKEAGISTKDLGGHEKNLTQSIEAANNKLKDQKNRLAEVTAHQKKLSAAKAQYERTTQLASNMTTAGAGALATGGGALYGGARLMQTGMEFDTSMSKVQSLARLEIDSEQMQALRAQARKLGAETMFSATEAAQGQGFLAMAGFTPQAILDAMPGMLDIAKAGDMDLARTADISSNILTGMNLEAADMGRVGDILVGTFTRSNTSLEMLGDTMKYVAPVGASVGQDIETVAAMAGKLGDAGIQGSMGGTALRSIINRLSSPPAAAAKALDKLGISAKDAQGNMRGMPDILTELYDKTKMMGDADRAAALKEIAGSEAVSAMQVLVKQAGSGELQKFITTLRQSEGEAAETARKMADNLTGDLDEFFSAFDDVKIEVFEGQNSALRDLAQYATAAMSSLGAWAKENPELVGSIVKVVAVLAALVAAGGALMVLIGSILGPLAMMKYGLTVLGIQGGLLVPVIKSIGTAMMVLGKAVLANPIFFAIAALAGAAYLIYQNWDDMVGGFKALLEAFGTWWADKTAILAQDWDYLTGLISAGWDSLWGGITGMLGGIWGTITEAFNGGIGGITALLLDWSPLGIFWQIMQPVFDWFGLDLPAKFSEFGANIIGGLVDGIKNMAGAAKDAVMNVGDNVTGWFKDKLGIHSPSRVFAELGGHTIDGLAVGMQAQEDGPLKRIGELGKKLTAAAGLSIPLLAGAAEPLQFDNRPPLQAMGNQGAAGGGNNYTIQITVNGTADTTSLAAEVRKQIEAFEREKAVRQRSRFGDLD